MNKQDDPLSRLSNVYESSISGLFQELIHKGIGNPPKEELKMGDVEGSDFKRLIQKKRHNKLIDENHLAAIEHHSNGLKQEQERIQKKHHINSPDFRPAVRLESNPSTSNQTVLSSFLGSKLKDLFAPRKDRYFNNDREELSKDIFPVEYQKS